MVDDIGLEQMKLDIRPKLVPWISRPGRPKRRHTADEGAKYCNRKCNSQGEQLFGRWVCFASWLDFFYIIC